MTAQHNVSNELSFAVEGMAGSAAAAALRRVRSLADQAPSGRLFSAIATLTEMSRRAETELEAGNAAAALQTMSDLAAAADLKPAPDAPSYLRKMP